MRFEKGQTIIEYFILLSVSIGMFVALNKKLIQPSFQQMKTLITQKLNNAFSGQNWYYYPIE
jgi:hypothetical protein